jgi:hypothetical protein
MPHGVRHVPHHCGGRAAGAITIPHVELKRRHVPLVLEYAKGLSPLDGDDE